jgi:catechol 2,3-dioxygenase-like lactoylglutathione lyase family enzyme
MITHINSVNVYVTDQDRALSFYRDGLGFEVNIDQQAGPDFRWISIAPAGAQTQLMLYRTTPNMAGKWPLVGTWTGMVLFCDDLDATYRELSERGVRFTELPRRMPWGGYEAQFADPDGNTFELVQRL